MAKLIQNRRVATDNWLLLKPEVSSGSETQPAVPAAGDVILPLALWRAQAQALLARQADGARTAAWLTDTDGAEAIAELLGQDLHRLPLIALNFPKFSNGRNLSTARLLRERYGYKGELRAVGDVQRDQLLGMYRCGIDSFVLRDDQDAADALAAFDELPVAYQASAVQPLPLFRRHAGDAGGART
jgi:uncharacterized protein (DUF934 family)